MDKTFSETQGIAPFDWNKALDAAIAQEPEFETWKDLKYRAMRWPSCACGNQCAIIPRNDDPEDESGHGAPNDPDLFQLGLGFYSHVEQRQWAFAKQTLVYIEDRAEILIRQELAKLNQPTP